MSNIWCGKQKSPSYIYNVSVDLIRQQHNFSNTGDDIIVDDRSGNNAVASLNLHRIIVPIDFCTLFTIWRWYANIYWFFLGDANEPKIVSNEQYISDEEAGKSKHIQLLETLASNNALENYELPYIYVVLFL